MTSNLGSTEIQAHAGEQNYDQIKRAVMDQVASHFRPEFINRIDESVVFHPLTREQIRAIAQIQLRALTARLKEKEIGISFSDAAMDTLGELGFDPVYGARPLKREIQQAIENPVAMSILAGEFESGDRISVDIDDDSQFSFAKQPLH
jgi:ATP-dependent Clp protease ATP-binding subunit ClpB